MAQHWLATVIDSAARGDERPTVAALRLLLHENDTAVDQAVRDALRVANDAAHERIALMASLLADARRHAPTLRAIAAAGAAPVSGDVANKTPPQGDVRTWAAAFDQAARIHHGAASALYALGDPARLAAATQEVVAYLDSAALIDEGARVLEIGAGSGRILAALSPWVRFSVGVEISAEMLAAATRSDNAAYVQTDGRNLRAFKNESFDLVLAVDSFPFITAAGLDAHHIGEAARVLAPNGALVVMNYSYRDNRNADQLAFAAACAAHGLTPTILGAQPFTLWNGAVFAARLARS